MRFTLIIAKQFPVVFYVLFVLYLKYALHQQTNHAMQITWDKQHKHTSADTEVRLRLIWRADKFQGQRLVGEASGLTPLVLLLWRGSAFVRMAEVVDKVS